MMASLKSMMKWYLPAALAMFIVVSGLHSIFSVKTDDEIKARVVKLVSPSGSCSGEQVRAPSGVDYILTAAHCRILEVDGSITAITEDGKHLQRRVLAEDGRSDLLLLEGLPKMRGLDIAKLDFPTEEVRTFTHGAGLDTYETKGVIIQNTVIQVVLFLIGLNDEGRKCDLPKLSIESIETPFGLLKTCSMKVEETVTTAMIVPGSSGGPVVNSAGDLIGVVSVGMESFSGLVRLGDIKAFLANY